MDMEVLTRKVRDTAVTSEEQAMALVVARRYDNITCANMLNCIACVPFLKV